MGEVNTIIDYLVVEVLTRCAVIAETLICPVILGRPFLKINQFIIEFAVPSCVSKIDGIDIFNETKIQTHEIIETKPIKETA